MKRLTFSFYVSLVIVISGAVVLNTALRLPLSTRIAAFGGPGTFPIAYLIMIITCSALLVVTELVKALSTSSGSKPSAKIDVKEVMQDVLRILLLLIAVAIYILNLRTVGFMISTPLLLLASLWLFGYRNIIISPILAIGFTVLLHLLFQTFLRVLLP